VVHTPTSPAHISSIGAAGQLRLSFVSTGSAHMRVWYDGPEKVRLAPGTSVIRLIRKRRHAVNWSSQEQLRHPVRAAATGGKQQEQPADPRRRSRRPIGTAGSPNTKSAQEQVSVAGRSA